VLTELKTTDVNRTIEVETNFRSAFRSYVTIIRMIDVGSGFRTYVPTDNQWIQHGVGRRSSDKKSAEFHKEVFATEKFSEGLKNMLKKYNVSLTQESIEILQSKGYQN
jgi:hypothetical protein